MKTSKIIAKLLVRLVFILILIAAIWITQNNDKLKGLGYIKLNQWALIYPVLLIAGFIGFLIASAVKKYNNMELNLLLIVNTVMLIIYAMAVFFRISAGPPTP
jgi:cation transport ATPase